jgi:spermidine synthase
MIFESYCAMVARSSMTRPWQTLERIDTPEGPLELRQRGDRDFLIVVGGRPLMTSQARRSEEALATLALRPLPRDKRRTIVIGGLGMGYTLRAALDELGPDARVTVVELNPGVAAWCKGPLAPLTDGAASDPRVTIVVADVADYVARVKKRSCDAILLDLYEGPHAATQPPDDPLYGPTALARYHDALATGGVLAVWGEEDDARFAKRLATGGWRAEKRHAGRGGRAHTIYLGYTLR